MHRVKNLNFSACLLELHSIFHVLFLLVDLHPLLVALHSLTEIEQVIYRWKAVVNTQLSCVDHFSILVTILRVFHLKFIQCSSRTSCCFHVELLWCIFVCNFHIHSSVLHKLYSFCTYLSHNNFFNFLRSRTWTYNNKIGPCILIYFSHIKHIPCSTWTFSIFIIWIYFFLKSNCSQIITELLCGLRELF